VIEPPHQDTRRLVPAEVAFPKTIKSYVRRAGRTTSGQAKAFVELGPLYLLPFQAGLLNWSEVFADPGTVDGPADGSSQASEAAAPVVLEIGFGMGDATAQIALHMPETRFLCCEVHEPGVGALLKHIGELGLTNIRIVPHDAVEVLDQMVAPQSLSGIHIFFPDPWHKLRHHKRRLIQAQRASQMALRLKPDGYLHCATDWEPYARQMVQVLSGEPLLRNSEDCNDQGYVPRPAYRPPTKFEKRGLRLGHGVWDVVFYRRA
jgi:tRNA (guanine-N7-)-methyltransferase